jgi:ATP-dependent Lon protease
LRDIVRYYTREAGVRNLERDISKICRKVVKALCSRKAKARRARRRARRVTSKNLDKYLGVRRFTYGIAEKKNQVGQVTGLAWTEVGGDLLTIEAVSLPGKGKTTSTGKLGDVMNESIAAALSVVRHRSHELGIPQDFYTKTDLHIHLPEGRHAEGRPERGGAIVTAIVSILTGIPVRCDVAMTGEITLRGEVLPIGGLKEKLLAAGRGGIKTVPDPGREREGPGRDSRRDQEIASTSIRSAGSSRCSRKRSSGSPHRCPTTRPRRMARRLLRRPRRRQDAGPQALIATFLVRA